MSAPATKPWGPDRGNPVRIAWVWRAGSCGNRTNIKPIDRPAKPLLLGEKIVQMDDDDQAVIAESELVALRRRNGPWPASLTYPS